MRMIWVHIQTSFKETFHFRAGEWAAAVMITLWGISVFGQPGLFETNASFSEFPRAASQVTWAIGAMIVGGLRLFVLLINGAWRRSYHWRAITAFLTCFFWMEISLSFYGSGQPVTALAIYPVLLVLDSYYVLRATHEAREEDERQWHRRQKAPGADERTHS